MMRFLAMASLCLAACATPSNKAEPLRAGEIVSAPSAMQRLSVGKTTKADVRAALGRATVVDFTSGYEVWVYRERPKKEQPAAELVLLFEPSGTLAKTRVR